MSIVDKQVKMIVDLIINQVQGDWMAEPKDKEGLRNLINHYSKDIFAMDDLQEQCPRIYDTIFCTLMERFEL